MPVTIPSLRPDLPSEMYAVSVRTDRYVKETQKDLYLRRRVYAIFRTGKPTEAPVFFEQMVNHWLLI